MFQKLEMGNISVNKYKTIVMFSVYFTENVETMCVHEAYCDFCNVSHRHTILFVLHSLVIY